MSDAKEVWPEEIDAKEATAYCFDKLKGFHAVGFDFDFALGRYLVPNIYNLMHRELVRFLVHHRKWPEALLDTTFDADLSQQGLCLQKSTGILLKLDKDKRVEKASFGRKFLSQAEIAARYPEPFEAINKDFHKFFGPWQLPMITVVADYIEIEKLKIDCEESDVWIRLSNDTSGSGYMNFTSLQYPDAVMEIKSPTLDGIDFSKSPPNFLPSLIADSGKFLENADRLRFIKELRKTGVMTFIITDSRYNVALPALEFLFGQEYNKLFDIVVTHSVKSRKFFKRETAFRKIGVKNKDGRYLREEFCEVVKVEKLEQFQTYGAGNKPETTEFLASLLGKDPKEMKILYLGDSLRSDIKSLKKDLTYEWILGYVQADLETLPHLDYSVVKENCALHDKVSKWGHLFTAGSRLSYWGAQIEKNADWVMADPLELGETKNPVETKEYFKLLRQVQEARPQE